MTESFESGKRDSFFLLRSSHPGREKSVLPHKFRGLARVSFGKSRKSFQLAITREIGIFFLSRVKDVETRACEKK